MVKSFFEGLKANGGFLSTALIICLGFAFLICQYTVTTGSFSEFISEWQTLITGLIALLGVLLTVWQIQKTQIESRENKLKRALIFLPNALADICTYASANMIVIGEDIEGKTPVEGVPRKLSDGVLEKLASIAECSDGVERQAIMRLAHWYQICYSRCYGYFGSEVKPINSSDAKYRMLCDFSDLHSGASKLFNFARERQSNMDISKTTFADHLNSMHATFSSPTAGFGGEALFSKSGFSDYQKKRYTTS